MFGGVFGRFWTFWDIMRCFGTCWDVLGRFGTRKDILLCLVHFGGVLGVFWDVLGRIGTFFFWGGEVLRPKIARICQK